MCRLCRLLRTSKGVVMQRGEKGMMVLVGLSWPHLAFMGETWLTMEPNVRFGLNDNDTHDLESC